ncbi:MAG: sigma-70 family RNA polymerase sigma factor [Pseudomonadota bacterium]
MLHEPLDLSELMRKANRGDAAAYRTFLRALASWLRVFVRGQLERMNRGADDVEDIVQETLLAVHLKRHTWSEREAIKPWVRAIAHHKMIDTLRRRGFRDHVDIDDLSDTLSNLVCVSADVGDAAGDCHKLLSTLPDKQRGIVEAIALRGLTAREAADEIGSTEGAVRVALHRSLKSLAKAYRQDKR